MNIHRMRNFFLEMNVIPEQIGVLQSFCKDYVNYRKIMLLLKSLDKRSNEDFFISISNSCVLSCVTSWCLLFGNPKNNKIHWHRSAPENGVSIDGEVVDNSEYKIIVGSILSNACSRHDKILDQYVFEMVCFRNKYAAHRDIGEYRPLPFLNAAFGVASAYMSWLSDEIFWAQPLETLEELQVSYESIVDSVLIVHNINAVQL
ncbi:hypothetical protein [Solidesulfovibrio magneticus]|uniref:hypothetical protein n=1 Tax=Solidesulfovibrio magneticus TaxID=184917 RepID=UPI0011D07C64|nr:hypothetical protein [Solidesulfovibrio magneticus]